MEYVILTGCTRGLGLALHDILVKRVQAERLIFIGRKLERVEQFLYATYIEADFVSLNIGSILSQLPYKKPTKLTLISNAGIISPICSVKKMIHSELEISYKVNFLAPSELISSLLNWINDVDFNIFNISSGAASQSIAGWSAYCSSKAAFKMYLDVLSKEQSAVNVKHIDPGIMDTDMQGIIRNTLAENMPDVEKFIAFKQDYSLKHPIEVANELIDILGLEAR